MRNRLFLIPLVALVITALACGGGSGGGPGTEAGPTALFKDDFADSGSGWGTDSGDNSAREYANGEYVMTISTDQWFAWDYPGDESFSDVHIEVTAKNVGEAQDATFGIICDYKDADNFYYLGIGSDGYYAIVKYAGEDVFLSDSDNKWIPSDNITQNKASYRLGADCGKGALTLYVDGKKIDAAQDSDFDKGNVGLFVLTFDTPNAEVHFDDLVVTALK